MCRFKTGMYHLKYEQTKNLCKVFLNIRKYNKNISELNKLYLIAGFK